MIVVKTNDFMIWFYFKIVFAREGEDVFGVVNDTVLDVTF